VPCVYSATGGGSAQLVNCIYKGPPFVFHFSRVEASASKWWFYIYSLVESFTRNNGTEVPAESSSEELIKTFKKFMEHSTLGEYEARLNILFTFHCHVIHQERTVCRGEACAYFCVLLE
jgi:midasin (ATPase involved in ribosome maturation)